MTNNGRRTWDIWRNHYIPPDNKLPYEKLAFIFMNKQDECWEEKFDTGLSDRTEALLIAARLQIAYRGEYAFIVRPNTFVPYTNTEEEEATRQLDILRYIESKLKPKEEEASTKYTEDVDELIGFDEEDKDKFMSYAEQLAYEPPNEEFLDPIYEKFDYYENVPIVEDDIVSDEDVTFIDAEDDDLDDDETELDLDFERPF